MSKDKQKRLFKKRRGGQVLTEPEVKEIKFQRKKLRKEMKQMGIKSKQEFELTASSMGYYFDKRRGLGALFWLLNGKALWALLGALLALLFVFFVFSLASARKGHFTINLSDDMFRNGFVLSETEDFADPVFELFSEPVEDAPCISISALPEDIEDWEGTHSDGTYFAYTFWLRNEGEDMVSYEYDILINSESQDLSTATWIMLFENGEMSFHAEESENGGEEALPEFGDNSRGYRITPFREQSRYDQYEAIKSVGNRTYYRAIPIPFVSETTAVREQYEGIAPGEVNKYTVVMWLEGDDPQCTDELIGGHLGLEMQFRLIRENEEESEEHGFMESITRLVDELKNMLKFWDVDSVEFMGLDEIEETKE